MPRKRSGEYSANQEKALRRAQAGGIIRDVPHSTARALRDRSLGEILAKQEPVMPNGYRPISRQFPSVVFRLNGTGCAEAARLMMAAGNVEGATNVQVASVPGGNK